MDLKHGIKSGYPLCCVLDFSLNEVIHRNDTRWIGAAANRPGSNKGYVLCYIHYWLATHKLKDIQNMKPLNLFELNLQSGYVLFSCISCKTKIAYFQSDSPTWSACMKCGRALLFVQNSRKWRHFS